MALPPPPLPSSFVSRPEYARELPLLSFSDCDNVGQVKAALRGLENGHFDRAALVVDAMGRDDRITGVLSTRSGALPSLPFTLEPGKGPKADAAMEALEQDWEKIFPDDQLTQLIEWGILIGAAPAQLRWEFGDRWTPTLECWHPRPLSFRWDLERYQVAHQEGISIITPGDGQWVLFSPYGHKRGWMRGRVRSLSVPWLVRQWALRDWARYSEIHGMPLRQVVTPAGATEEEEQAFVREVASIGTESVIRSRRIAGGTGDPKLDRFEVQLVEALGKSKEVFEGLVNLANDCVAINLLGQNLSTEVKGGSFAAAQAHTAIRNDILESDAKLAGQCLRTQVLRVWAALNFGDPEAAPTPRWRTKPDEDRVAKATAIKLLGEGLQALQSTGAQVDIDKVLEDEGIPTTGPAEEPMAKQQMAADAEAKAEAAKNPPPPGTGLDNRPKLAAELEERGATLEGHDIPKATVAGQLYADKVATAGRDEAKRIVAPDLATLLELVDKATSFEGLRKELEELYKHMEPDRLARVIREALVMAQLGGMHSVLEEGQE